MRGNYADPRTATKHIPECSDCVLQSTGRLLVDFQPPFTTEHEAMLSKILDFRCEFFHGGFMWPIQGFMKCRGCQRRSSTAVK
jgi:hypothetical protein